MRGIDAVLQEIPGGAYDLKIGFDGDLETEDSFDTAIIVSLFTDARANESEVLEASRRRGWIGNERTPGFQVGSKLWLLEQSRLTRTVMNQARDESRDALRWMVEDELAVSIGNARAFQESGSLFLEVTIQRTSSEVEKRLFELWSATGTRS